MGATSRHHATKGRMTLNISWTDDATATVEAVRNK